jgi:hypothetical protein
VVEAKRKPPEQIRKELHHEVVREIRNTLLFWHPVGVRSLPASTDGLRFASTTGYFLATPRVASLHFKLESTNDKSEMTMENRLLN